MSIVLYCASLLAWQYEVSLRQPAGCSTWKYIYQETCSLKRIIISGAKVYLSLLLWCVTQTESSYMIPSVNHPCHAPKTSSITNLARSFDRRLLGHPGREPGVWSDQSCQKAADWWICWLTPCKELIATARNLNLAQVVRVSSILWPFQSILPFLSFLLSHAHPGSGVGEKCICYFWAVPPGVEKLSMLSSGPIAFLGPLSQLRRAEMMNFDVRSLVIYDQDLGTGNGWPCLQGGAPVR